MKRLCLKEKHRSTRKEPNSIWKSFSFFTTLEKRMSLSLWLCRRRWKVQTASILMILSLLLKKSREVHKKLLEKWKKMSKRKFFLLRTIWIWQINIKKQTIKLLKIKSPILILRLKIKSPILIQRLKIKSPILILRWNRF